MEKVNSALGLGVIVLLFMIYGTLDSIKSNMELSTQETVQIRQSIQGLPNNLKNNGF